MKQAALAWWRRAPEAPLFAQVLGLVFVSLIAAQAINLFIIFNLPPPIPDYYRVSEVAAAYKGQSITPREGPPLIVRSLSKPPEAQDESRTIASIRQDFARDAGVAVADVVISSDFGRWYPDRRVLRTLRDRMIQDDARLGPPAGQSPGASAGRGDTRGLPEHILVPPFKVGVHQADGTWRTVQPRGSLLPNAWQRRILLWFVISALALAPLAYLFARRLSGPFGEFAGAAERLGRDPNAPPLGLRGAAEIGRATRAFNEMQERLRRYVEDRTAMIGAVAHDLRTPLTRLRFRIENLPEDQKAKIAADLDQMEAMVAATLAFVRDASKPAERTQLELSSLLESLTDEMADTGADAAVERADKIVVEGDPIALRRMFANLLDNAVKFGGKARARVVAEPQGASVEIDDDGPGVPQADMERVFEPFYRREPSRSRATGGIGLGLAVVRSIARAHGGDAELVNRPGGGLTARVRLPV